MYTNVTEEWVYSQSRAFAPEGFVEIDCYIPQLGRSLTFAKRDLLRFVHQQTASVLSAELPKNHIEFSLDNSNGKWNPNNPDGLYQYLSERLKITVRYGFNINGAVEWIPGGVFYLTEWSTSENGYEATFAARDILEYMLDASYTGELSGTLGDLARSAMGSVDLPEDGVSAFGEVLDGYTLGEVTAEGDISVAQVLQKCANASRCVMYQNRDGALVIAPWEKIHTNYTIPLKLAYSFPKIELTRPLKSVEVTYLGGEKYSLNMRSAGETQTLSNDFISTAVQANEVAEWVDDMLCSRKTISGEFRGDPRLDVLDLVAVETKGGMVENVVLTNVKTSFTGAFMTTFSGYINYEGAAVTHYSGELYAGEVI